MKKIEPNYLKCIVIVHGKSEKQICEYIKSNLRFHMEIISKMRGKSSIQINGLQTFLNKDRRFENFKNFKNYFPDIEIVSESKKKRIAPYFKLFIIMDTDDCLEEQKGRYINKQLFKNHWLYDYIVPIFNSPELESVMIKAGIKFQKKGQERKTEYIKIFPTDDKYKNNESVELNSFFADLKAVKETNMDNFIHFCLEKS